MKIHIIGCSGSGKTYFAKALSRKFGLEKGKKETFKSVYNLIKWTDTWQKKNLPEIEKILQNYQYKTIRLQNADEVNSVISNYVAQKH